MALTAESISFTIDLFVPCDGDDDQQQVMHIYRYIKGGICSPFSAQRPCANIEQAVEFAREMGYAAVGEWTHSASGSSSIEAIRIS